MFSLKEEEGNYLVEHIANDRLLRAVAEQLKLPLLQIVHLADLMQSSQEESDLRNVRYVAQTALQLVDGFLLSADSLNQEVFQLEPVSIASVLNDTAHKLTPMARQNECKLELSVKGRYEPVMANHRFLESALMLLGYGMIESRSADSDNRQVLLAAHKSNRGLVAGVFDDLPAIGIDSLRRGRALFGDTRQPVPSAFSSSSASIFVADALFRAMETTLYPARHRRFTGLAATFHLSTQLSIL